MEKDFSQVDGLPATLATVFPDIIVIREIALALDEYMRSGDRGAVLIALQGCYLPQEKIVRMLEIIDAGGRDE